MKRIVKLSKKGDNRYMDTPTELRIRLKKTLKLFNGHVFFNEDTDKGNQIVAATLFPDGKTLDVVLFVNRL